jgi:hypothetical protein
MKIPSSGGIFMWRLIIAIDFTLLRVIEEEYLVTNGPAIETV